jgi:hypothetical protein
MLLLHSRIFSVEVLLCNLSVLIYARNSVGLFGDFDGFERVYDPSGLFLCTDVAPERFKL